MEPAVGGGLVVGHTPIRTRLFAAIETRLGPTHVLRLCALVIKRVRVLVPLDRELDVKGNTAPYAITLAVGIESARHLLRSPDVPLQLNHLVDVPVDFSYSIQYPHSLKDTDNTLRISIQRRKRSSKPKSGFKFLCSADIDLAQVLQKPVADQKISLFETDGAAAVAEITIGSLLTSPVLHDGEATRRGAGMDAIDELVMTDDEHDIPVDAQYDDDDLYEQENLGSDSDEDVLPASQAHHASGPQAHTTRVHPLKPKAQGNIRTKFTNFMHKIRRADRDQPPRDRLSRDDDDDENDSMDSEDQVMIDLPEDNNSLYSLDVDSESIKTTQQAAPKLRPFFPHHDNTSLTTVRGKEGGTLTEEADDGYGTPSTQPTNAGNPHLLPLQHPAESSLQSMSQQVALLQATPGTDLPAGDSILSPVPVLVVQPVTSTSQPSALSPSSAATPVPLSSSLTAQTFQTALQVSIPPANTVPAQLHQGATSPGFAATTPSSALSSAEKDKKLKKLAPKTSLIDDLPRRTSDVEPSKGSHTPTTSEKPSTDVVARSLSLTDPRAVEPAGRLHHPVEQVDKHVLTQQLSSALPSSPDIPVSYLVLVDESEACGLEFGRKISHVTPQPLERTQVVFVHSAAEISMSFNAVITRLQLASTPNLKIVLCGSDPFFAKALRHFVDLGSRDVVWQTQVVFCVVPLTSESRLASSIASVDSTYGSLFLTKEWFEAISTIASNTEALALILERIQFYLTYGTSKLSHEIGEARLLAPEHGGQTCLPFLHTVHVCVMNHMVEDVSEEPADSASSGSDSVELHLDYWPPVLPNPSTKSKDKEKDRDDAKITAKGNFRCVKVIRNIVSDAVAGEGRKQGGNPFLLNAVLREKTKGITFKLGKKSKDVKDTLLDVKIVKAVCNAAEKAKTLLTVNVDGLVCEGVQHFTVAMQWPTYTKYFPIATFKPPTVLQSHTIQVDQSPAMRGQISPHPLPVMDHAASMRVPSSPSHAGSNPFFIPVGATTTSLTAASLVAHRQLHQPEGLSQSSSSSSVTSPHKHVPRGAASPPRPVSPHSHLAQTPPIAAAMQFSFDSVPAGSLPSPLSSPMIAGFSGNAAPTQPYITLSTSPKFVVPPVSLESTPKPARPAHSLSVTSNPSATDENSDDDFL
eukprot:m.233730 g.233730  ORF g.233730 m.233730 type:complete len:1145 (+) comp54299_c0_seq18:139-3573(+)